MDAPGKEPEIILVPTIISSSLLPCLWSGSPPPQPLDFFLTTGVMLMPHFPPLIADHCPLKQYQSTSLSFHPQATDALVPPPTTSNPGSDDGDDSDVQSFHDWLNALADFQLGLMHTQFEVQKMILDMQR